jgi:predicted branched-subunit amino acid permease
MTTIDPCTHVGADPATPTDLRWSVDAVRGVQAMLPWLIGVAPLGMVVGMNASEHGLSGLAALATGAGIYSGSAQLTAIELIGGGATVAVVVVSVLVINARLILYGSSLAPKWHGTSPAFRALASYLLVDPSYAVGMNRYAEGSRAGAHAHYIAAGITLWVAWHGSIVAGITLGTSVPEQLRLEQAVPLFLVAEIVRVGRRRGPAVAAAVGGVATAAGTGLPLHSGLLLGVGTGVAAASFIDRRRS